MRRNTFILFWGLLFSILVPLIILAIVAICYSEKYPGAFEQTGIMTEGRRALFRTIDKLRPAIGLTSVAGLILGFMLGLFQKLPGTKINAARTSKAVKNLLKKTSRSFYLTLRVLPRAIRPQIGLAYLLARTTDTIADTEIVPLPERLGALQKLRGRILGTNGELLNFGELAQRQTLPAEQTLLEKVEESLALLKTLSSGDLQFVRKVLDTITGGQELDLTRFAAASKDNIIALRTEGELDDYTYRVAGCVGEFWTDMCISHLFRLPELEDLMWSNEFRDLGIRFGKGLQLVNILRDLPADLQKGRCYMPSEKLLEIGLKPADLLVKSNENRFRPLYNRYLDLAQTHLSAGWKYTNRIPFTWMSVRLACAWPILIGMKTIERLRTANVLDAGQRVKISRPEVRGIIARSVLLYPFPGAWRKMVR